MSRELDGLSEIRGMIVAGKLNTREGPGNQYKKNGQVSYGTKVTIFAEEEYAGAKWYCISIGHWVHGGWVHIYEA